MSEPTAYERIRQHLDDARQLVEQANAALTNEEYIRADRYSKDAREAVAEAEQMVEHHRPSVVHNTVRTGEMRKLQDLDWVRVYDPVTGRFASVRWSDIDGEATS